MNETFAYTLLAFTSMLAMVNPVSAIPIYLATTADYSEERRNTTLRRAILIAFIMMASFALLGTWIFKVFGITIPAFRIAGGILIFRVGLDMIQAKRSSVKATVEEEEESTHREDVAIIPLGTPSLAGPGALTTSIAMISRATNGWDAIGFYVGLAAVCVVTWVVLRIAPLIAARLGQTGMNVVQRVLGLLVLVVGVQFLIDGSRAVALEVGTQLLGK